VNTAHMIDVVPLSRFGIMRAQVARSRALVAEAHPMPHGPTRVRLLLEAARCRAYAAWVGGRLTDAEYLGELAEIGDAVNGL
jgi:hypothetical protein